LLAGLLTAALFGLLGEVLGAGGLTAWYWSLLRLSMPLIRVARYPLWPLVRLCEFGRERLERIGDELEDEDDPTPADEIISLVEQAEEDDEDNGGASAQASEHRMVRSIFEMSETMVREIMTPRVDLKAVPRDASIATVVALVLETGHSRIPVFKETVDEIIGIVYSKDLLDTRRLAPDATAEQVARAPMFVPATKDVKSLLEEFKSTQNHLAVVIDEYGGTAGVVTIEDILEEIVGDIRDEYDGNENTDDLVHEADGAIVVEARASIGDINDILGVRIPDDEDYDTVAGYISTELGRIPRPPEIIRLGDLEVQVLEGDERRMNRLRLRRLSDEDSHS